MSIYSIASLPATASYAWAESMLTLLILKLSGLISKVNIFSSLVLILNCYCYEGS